MIICIKQKTTLMISLHFQVLLFRFNFSMNKNQLRGYIYIILSNNYSQAGKLIRRAHTLAI